MPLCSNFITALAALQEHYYRALFWFMRYWLSWSVWGVEELVLNKHLNTPSFGIYFLMCLEFAEHLLWKIPSNSTKISLPVLCTASKKKPVFVSFSFQPRLGIRQQVCCCTWRKRSGLRFITDAKVGTSGHHKLAPQLSVLKWCKSMMMGTRDCCQ